MRFLSSIDVSASGMTAQRLRLDTIASNMANVETTRNAEGTGPYLRQIVVFQAKENRNKTNSFAHILQSNIEEEFSKRTYGQHDNKLEVRPIKRLYPGKDTIRPRRENDYASAMATLTGGGVRVVQIRSLPDEEYPLRMVYDPTHPDADEEGYVAYPNVNIVEEMVNMISATRSYEANAKVIEATRGMAMRALEIGR